MTEVDGQVDLIVLWDVKDVLLVLHVNCHELVANFRSVLRIVDRAEQLSLDILLQLHVGLKLDAFALDLFAPAVLIEALSEENDVGQDDLVVVFVDSIRHSIQIQGEDFIDKHILSISICKTIVVSLPLLRIG